MQPKKPKQKRQKQPSARDRVTHIERAVARLVRRIGVLEKETAYARTAKCRY